MNLSDITLRYKSFQYEFSHPWVSWEGVNFLEHLFPGQIFWDHREKEKKVSRTQRFWKIFHRNTKQLMYFMKMKLFKHTVSYHVKELQVTLLCRASSQYISPQIPEKLWTWVNTIPGPPSPAHAPWKPQSLFLPNLLVRGDVINQTCSFSYCSTPNLEKVPVMVICQDYSIFIMH